MAKLFLHIGLGKTGTTAIQFWLAANRTQLAGHGWFYPAIGYFERGRAHHALSHKWGGWIKPELLAGRNLDAEWCALRDHIAAASDDSAFIVSSERFAAASMDPRYSTMLPYLSDVLRGIDVRIVIYLRRHDDLAEAYYKQMVKAGLTTAPIEDFVQNLPPEFDFSELQKRWGGAFGADRLIVRWYEPMMWPDGDVVRDFRAALGISDDSAYLPSERMNESISAASVAEVIAQDIAGEKNRPRLLNAIRSEHDGKPGKLLDEAARARIISAYAAKGNRTRDEL